MNNLANPRPAPILTANNLYRQLGEDTAVESLSLTLNTGDIVALLGLNGAGKTTTLQMLSGVLVPDSGSVTVNGFNLADNPQQARRYIGYLPDEPPLYRDMRVHDYLQLAGHIHRLTKPTLRQRLPEVIAQCQLTDVRNSRIATLSKGYRQRVGLAQALIHSPALLILDEPSNGLDPQQLTDMRTLISDVGQTAAVILSTHLLTEAQQLCNRVVIIHQGKLVCDQPASEIQTLEQLFHGAVT